MAELRGGIAGGSGGGVRRDLSGAIARGFDDKVWRGVVVARGPFEGVVVMAKQRGGHEDTGFELFSYRPNAMSLALAGKHCAAGVANVAAEL